MAGKGFTIATLDGGRLSLTVDQLESLSKQVQGGLLRSGDEGWDEAVLLWNGAVQREPALVVQPASARDVAAAVTFARDHGILMSVKGGGHNIAGTAIAEHGLMLDMSRIRKVIVDPDARLVHAGGGCLLGDVDRATQQHGLATPLGFVSETGLAGLTLGGGFGYLTRRFGWTVDNLEEVEIVTADGEVRIVNRDEHPELFWALRGGGGNFGVVTRFTFRLHSVGPAVTGGLMVWPGDRTDDVLATYRELTETAPRELTAALNMRLAPPAPFVPPELHGKPVIGMVLCYDGTDPEALAPIRGLGEPVVNLVTERSYVEQQSLLNAMEPKGPHRYWKSEFLPRLPAEYLETFRDQALRVASPMSQSVMFHLGGAVNERDDDDGAVGNRDARYVMGLAGVWTPEMPAAPVISWVRESWQRILPFSTGGNYVNFQTSDDDPDRTAAAYGKNFERLQRVKAQYDPGNLFRVNRNVSPAA